MAKVLVVGDLHCPATRVGYLEFCQDLYEQWDCNTVVLIGDVVDWHAISFHSRNPGCPGPTDEYHQAREYVAKWAKAFPTAKVAIGNHDERPRRLARTVSIPDFMVRDYSDLWDAPGWVWDWRFSIDGVSFRHGTGCSGVHPAWNLMHKIHKSVVIGHCHGRAGVKWACNEDRRLFGMDVGCGVDETAMQMAYGRDYPVRPFLSAGVVVDGIPYHEPMRCGKGEPYHDSKFKKRRR